MPRKNEYGKYILSAGEIGSFTVCPESWRLRYVDRKKKSAPDESVAIGERLHVAWAEEHDKLSRMLRATRIVLLLALLAIAVTILVRL